MAWTETQVDMLKTLWAEGYSASQIANQIGIVTRNAVIGKIHRLGLAARDKPSRRTKAADKQSGAPQTTVASTKASPAGGQADKAQRTKSDPARKEPVKPDRPALPRFGTTSVLDIRDSMCKWPIGDPSKPDFAFCGRPKNSGSSYCKAHAEIAYQPARKRDAPDSQKPLAG